MTKRLVAFGLFSVLGSLARQGAAQTLMSVDDYPVTSGYVVRDYDAHGATPLLAWFDYFYVFSDHHIRQIFALPLANDVHVSFMDDDGEDTIGYSVGHWATSGVPWRSITSGCAGLSCVETLTDKPAGSVFVLVGFSVWFKNSDHHLRQLSINENDGKLVVWFGDKGYDDPVGFRVDYGWVPQNRVLAQGEWGDGGTADIYAPYGEIPDGPIVIRGFNASYIELDHHVSRLAVYPDQISLYDKNRDDAIRGNVRWAKLGRAKSPYFPADPPVLEVAR
jgi:hypothetical protein